MRNLFLRNELNERVNARYEGRAIVHDELSAKQKSLHAREIHDPSGCGVLHRRAPMTEFPMQSTLFPRAHYNASNAVHDAFRLSGRPAAVHDQKPVLEFHPLEVDIFRQDAPALIQKLIQSHHIAHPLHIPRPVQEPRHRHNPLEILHTLHPPHNLRHLVAHLKRLAVINRRVVDKHPLGLNLPQALQNPSAPHITAATAKQRPQLRRAKEHAQRIQPIARYERDAITLHNAARLHRRREAEGARSQLAPCDFPLRGDALSDLDDGDTRVFLVELGASGAVGRVGGVEDVFGKVEAQAGEPLGQGVDGDGFVDDVGGGAGGDDGEGLVDIVPEVGAAGDGVGVQGFEGLRRVSSREAGG